MQIPVSPRSSIFVIVCVTVLIGWPARGQNIDEMRTLGLGNGRLWKVMAAGTRAEAGMYVAGVIEASLVDKSLVAQRFLKCNCGYGEISVGVSKIYDANPAYLRIPIPYVINFYLGIATGALTDRQVQEEAADILRRLP